MGSEPETDFSDSVPNIDFEASEPEADSADSEPNIGSEEPEIDFSVFGAFSSSPTTVKFMFLA